MEILMEKQIKYNYDYIGTAPQERCPKCKTGAIEFYKNQKSQTEAYVCSLNCGFAYFIQDRIKYNGIPGDLFEDEII